MSENILQDGILYRHIGKGVWAKDQPYYLRAGKTFFYRKCSECGRLVSNCGWAYTKHEKKHERERAKKVEKEMAEDTVCDKLEAGESVEDYYQKERRRGVC